MWALSLPSTVHGLFHGSWVQTQITPAFLITAPYCGLTSLSDRVTENGFVPSEYLRVNSVPHSGWDHLSAIFSQNNKNLTLLQRTV